MPLKVTPLDEVAQEHLESLLEVMEQARTQILARLGTVDHSQFSKELEERLMLMLALPVLPPYP